MKRLLQLFLLTASAVSAQNALWIDLSGNWHILYEDRPEFASTTFDDHSWTWTRLPAGQKHQLLSYWLRRQVVLPEGTDLDRITLSLGTIQGSYEVYINGVRRAATGSMTSFSDAELPYPRVFRIPAGVLRDRKVQLAIRVRMGMFMPPGWRIPDTGPYELTYAEQAPLDAGKRAVDEQWMVQSPRLMFASGFLVIAVIAFLAWRTDGSRRELLWFAIIAFNKVFEAVLFMALLSEHSHALAANGVAVWQLLADTFQYPLFGQFVLAALGLRRRWPYLLLWGGWSVEPLMLLVGGNVRLGTYGGNIWCNVFVLGVIVWNWRTVARSKTSVEAHALRGAMLTVALAWAGFWAYQAVYPFSVVSGTVIVRGLEIAPEDVVWLLLSATITALLLRRLAADRREGQRLSGELQAARTIQSLLIGNSPPGTDTFPVQAAYWPAFEVGGDFYQVLPLKNGGLLVAVGDVSGKGLRAAMVVSLLTGALLNRKADRPGALLCELNRVAANALDGDFVTATIALFERDGRVTIASAGHPSPYLSGQEVALDSGLPLGIDTCAEYMERELMLDSGCQLTLVSDGVIEAASAEGELFGFERTQEISRGTAVAISEAAKSWGQNDDITVVIVERAR